MSRQHACKHAKSYILRVDACGHEQLMKSTWNLLATQMQCRTLPVLCLYLSLLLPVFTASCLTACLQCHFPVYLPVSLSALQQLLLFKRLFITCLSFSLHAYMSFCLFPLLPTCLSASQSQSQPGPTVPVCLSALQQLPVFESKGLGRPQNTTCFHLFSLACFCSLQLDALSSKLSAVSPAESLCVLGN